MIRTALLCALALLLSGGAFGKGGVSLYPTAVPAGAQSAGYGVRTFYSTFQSDIDLSNTEASGFNWYSYNFFSSNANMAQVVPIGGGGVNLLGDTTGPNAEISTITLVGSSFKGTAFGGGFYTEASLSFNPSVVLANSPGGGWPSFWALSEEKATGNDQWIGQAAGYAQYEELDFFEYLLYGSITNYYYGTMHDWYGLYNVTCSGFCNIQNGSNAMAIPSPASLTAFHKYGFLWVPATSTTSGYGQYYSDGLPVGTRVTWTQYTNQSPPPTGMPWLHGVTDVGHYALLLGTGPNETMTVQYVGVWQASAANNITH